MNKTEETSLIRAGADAIARWRKDNPRKRIDEQGTVVEKLDLSGADLADANLSACRFIDCSFQHVRFANADLSTAQFLNCRLDDADFRGADLSHARILAQSMNGARFGHSATLGRLVHLDIIEPVTRPILVDHALLPWYDRWVGWDRLRFLATIRIFVPAYASLTLTVLYLNGIAWYNSAAKALNARVAQSDLPLIPLASPTWTHGLVLLNFACLAVAATAFLGCPARTIEFSRERWLNELRKPEILYDQASLQRPLVRLLCAGFLLSGGLLSSFLLGRAIWKQAGFILGHLG